MKTMIDKINAVIAKYPKVRIDSISGSDITTVVDMAKLSVETLNKMKEISGAIDIYVTYRPAQNTQGIVAVFVF